VEAKNTWAPVTPVILAGGLGTRLRSAVADRPKVLAEIHGQPFLSFLLDQLLSAGIGHALLCTGYLAEQVQAVFGASYKDLRLSYSREPALLGTGGALRLALPSIKSEWLLVMNGDSYCDVSLAEFWSWHAGRAAPATLLLTRVPDTGRFGRVHVDLNGRILSFDEKSREPGPGLINAGIYFLRRAVVEALPPGSTISLERNVFPSLIGNGLYGFCTSAPFLDIGIPEALAQAEAFLEHRVQSKH